MQSKQQSQFKVEFKFHLYLEFAELYHCTYHNCYSGCKSNISSDKPTIFKRKRWIIKINFPAITESVRITKDHHDCHSAFCNLYNNFSVFHGGLSHIRQRANEEHKNNSSNASENKTVAGGKKKALLGKRCENADKKP